MGDDLYLTLMLPSGGCHMLQHLNGLDVQADAVVDSWTITGTSDLGIKKAIATHSNPLNFKMGLSGFLELCTCSRNLHIL